MMNLFGGICKLGIVAGAFGAIATFLWGGADEYLYALLAFVGADLLSGVIAARITNTASSRKLINGFFRKLLYFVAVSVASILDYHVLDAGGTIRNFCVVYLIAGEGLSILENCGRCGLPIPPKLLAALEQLRDNEGGK